ncbi:UDP-glucose 4-epimerase [Candidatus Hydrogenisulfobacillus filiaventi]|uniref:UDP-glucose 4-epimerase n=1 Tax=Candidatus Hydrogenisulfobacillus filiaventi TaxID=2707344 RepID=A0A6F8ZEP3_9FIRM|nr:UDP-glucose 4-epimerase GalE [Bacillota bacterium]CAB1128338.1 UDP-glucose 4-epimerase [Candidatus Hydrogenisulfobacillus filiaventi]
MSGKPAVAVVTGGLGYIGQTLAAALQAQGMPVVAVDRRAVPAQVAGLEVWRGRVGDAGLWQALAARYRLRVVYHCAGLISVAESVAEPGPYFRENVSEGLAMLEALRGLGPVPVVFSSSAAVYGVPAAVPIPEEAPLAPVNPYGVTKRVFEEALAAYGRAYGLPWVALRYFNAAGTAYGVRERHEPETHVIPRMAAALQGGEAPVVFGTDYPTPDGSAVRDYIHVADLVDAHLKAAAYLEAGGPSLALNLGSGRGTSVLELAAALIRVSGRAAEPRRAPRRPGDPPALVAAIGRARQVLAWEPVRSADLEGLLAEVWADVSARA